MLILIYRFLEEEGYVTFIPRSLKERIMKYFVSAIFLIGLSMLMSGGISEEGFDAQDPVITEIVCESGEGFVCTENITFPALHFKVDSK
jgi:hypothetical protein